MGDYSRDSVSTMPGHRSTSPAGTMCDDHQDRPATHRVQGETDSMGCEYNDWCEECYGSFQAAFRAPRDGYCDWHKGSGTDIRQTRDYDEGSSGPLYNVCRSCRIQASEEARRELAHDPDWWFHDDGYFLDDES